ncbi:MAG: DUF3237 domain-containing protein [Gammaproteobacteria bacterium]|nr:DUF3237 domain-containing protein [Gammaproteobacteria bacterium]
MKLKPLMTLRALLRQPADIVGDTPLGQRGVAEVVEGSFEGERLSGSVVTPGPTGTSSAAMVCSTSMSARRSRRLTMRSFTCSTSAS